MFFGLRTFGSLRSMSVPPAASTFSRAVADAACTVMVSFFESSPTPSSFTSLRIERMRPFAFSDSGVTSSPASKRSRSRRFTGWVYVRNGPTGIASLDVLPRSLAVRMCSGIWPPSNPARIACEPERDFWPLIPRPE
jgi:hypothetical protein